MNQNKYTGIKITLMGLDLITLLCSFFSIDYISEVLLNKQIFMSHDVIIELLGPIFLAYSVVFVLFNQNQDFLLRGYLNEWLYIIKMNILYSMVILMLLFFMKTTLTMARTGLFGAMGINIVFMGVLHCLYKKYVRYWFDNKRNCSHVYVITTSDRVEKIIGEFESSQDMMFSRIRGIALLDTDRVGGKIQGINVVASLENVLEFARTDIVDDVYINVPDSIGKTLKQCIMELENMGITVHFNVNVLEGYEAFNKEVDMYGPYPVITFASKFFDSRKMIVKRMVDIAGAIVGLIITAIVTVFLAPILLLESPGPLFFKQKRVGKNGRYFYMYKFRSMYKDAEERKKALMEQNEMKGLMFKMTDDPRITKVGKFIRATSIDELPQFLNVLKGDMSLVGTRPPTVDEFVQYAGYHKRRLSIKPGITGLWQVSGRSDIEDFEEVVRLDLEYIDNWSLMLDLKILMKTFVVVFNKVGSK